MEITTSIVFFFTFHSTASSTSPLSQLALWLLEPPSASVCFVSLPGFSMQAGGGMERWMHLFIIITWLPGLLLHSSPDSFHFPCGNTWLFFLVVSLVLCFCLFFCCYFCLIGGFLSYSPVSCASFSILPSPHPQISTSPSTPLLSLVHFTLCSLSISAPGSDTTRCDNNHQKTPAKHMSALPKCVNMAHGLSSAWACCMVFLV